MQHSMVSSKNLENESLRIDAEYYRPEYIEIEKAIKSKEWNYLNKYISSLKSFGAYSLCNQVQYEESGIPYLRCQDIKNGQIDLSNCLFINDDVNKLLWKSEVLPGMVLLTMSGTVGNAAVATKNLPHPINSNQDIVKIMLEKELNPFYLTAYLNSYYGKGFVNRLPIGSIQQHIFLWQVKKIIVPEMDMKFQNYIERLYNQAVVMSDESIFNFNEAQDVLLNEIGLNKCGPGHQKSFVKKYSDTANTERMDAEHFQPKYDKVVEVLSKYSRGHDKLSQLITVCDNNYVPIQDQKYKYIELADIGNNGVILSYTEELGGNLPTRARKFVYDRDVLISSIEGSLDKIALIEKQHHQSLCSTGFFVLRSDVINPETMLVFFKSLAGQMQLKRGCRGTILTAINKGDLKEVFIPLIEEAIQKDIALKVQKSFELRNMSNHLLKIAKYGVELAIEKDEQTSEEWMKVETDKHKLLSTL